MKFWVPWGIDVVVALVFVCFFFIGLADGSVGSFNIVLWLVILGVLAAVVGGSLRLRSAGRSGLATALLTILAVPSVLIGLFFVVLMVAPVRWN